jgi:hypothetical protein
MTEFQDKPAELALEDVMPRIIAPARRDGWEDWMLASAYSVLASAPVDPADALPLLAMAKRILKGSKPAAPKGKAWMSAGARSIVSLLPADDRRALAVIDLAREIVKGINVPYMARGKRT